MIRCLGALVIFSVAYAQVQVPAEGCSEGWTLLNNKCYAIKGARSPMREARELCETKFDAELVTFETTDEFNLVASWLNGNSNQPRPSINFDLWVNAMCPDWLGAQRGSAVECPGGFSWGSGDSLPTSSSMWMPARPRSWLNGRSPPDGVVMWRIQEFQLENRPSVFKKGGGALCEKGPESANLKVDECATGAHNCDDNALCTNTEESFTCACNEGYNGNGYTCQEIDECASNQCTQGTCVDGMGSYTCDCDGSGFTGEFCETKIDECAGSQCSHGTCVDGVGLYTCDCTGSGYSGIFCENKIDECASNQCSHGTCVDKVASYTCECSGSGFTGEFCDTKIDECANSPCGAGKCIDGINSFTCDCTDTGFSGPQCETNINECAVNPCAHGTCTDGVNSHTCDCTGTGFSGSQCETNINDCAVRGGIPCNHGTCLDRVNGFTCDCTGTGFSGATCDTNIDDCTDSTCAHGTCIDGVKGYTCDCAGTGFSGATCDTNIDDCTGSTCAHGTCIDGVNGYTCDCSDGYSGTTCDALIDGGWGFIESKSMPGKCIDVYGSPGTHNLANIHIYDCEYSKVRNELQKIDQLWRHDPNGHLVNRASKKCLDVFGWSCWGNGKNINLFSCEAPGTKGGLFHNKNSDQFWEFQYSTNPWFRIRNQSTGKCLDVFGWSKNKNQQNIDTWTCESYGQTKGGWFHRNLPTDQFWKFVPLHSVSGFRGPVQ